MTKEGHSATETVPLLYGGSPSTKAEELLQLHEGSPGNELLGQQHVRYWRASSPSGPSGSPTCKVCCKDEENFQHVLGDCLTLKSTSLRHPVPGRVPIKNAEKFIDDAKLLL